MSSTLKRSERNCIIEDFRNGIINPNYEVIQTKTKGRYTVRKRKVPLTEEQLASLNEPDDDDTEHQGFQPWRDGEYDDDEPMPRTKSTPRKGTLQHNKVAVSSTPQHNNSQAIDYAGFRQDSKYFDLQNQLNEQMLYRLNELTNKVIKLKTWKKKVKQDLYSEDVEPNEVHDEVHDEPSPSPSPSPSSVQVNEVNEVNDYEYLNKIPQEYISGNDNDMTSSVPSQYEQLYNTYRRSSKIDYSKFGF